MQQPYGDWNSGDWNSKWCPLPFHHPLPSARLHLLPAPTPAIPKPTRVIFICQEHSALPTTNRSQNELDEVTLTEAGRIMARQAGAWLRGTPVDAIYASPLKRSQQAVKELLVGMEADWHRLNPIHLHWHLQEVDLPEASEGVPRPGNRATDDDTACLSTFSPAIIDLYDRAHLFWQNILPRHCGQTVLVASHNNINQALINTALGRSAHYHHKIQQSSGSMSLLNFTEQPLSTVQLHTLNATHHLEEGLPQLKPENRGLRLLLLPVPITSIQQKQIRQLLQAVDINFSLSAEEAPQDLITGVLAHHAKTVHLQVAREDVAQVWQRSIMQRKPDSEQLITGLIIAPIPMIQSLLQQAIEGEQHPVPQLAIQAGYLSVIHYPAHSPSPILQTINLGFDHRIPA